MEKLTIYRELRGEDIEIKYALTLVGKDLLLVVTGGQAHIGSVVLAQPRPSLAADKPAATSNVLNLPGHKDELVLRQLAEELCRLSGQTVTALGGVHVEPFNQRLLVQVQRINQTAIAQASAWLQALQATAGPPQI